MKPGYEPKTREQILGYLVEECGEVLAAAGKTLRWGDSSVNPELPTACGVCGRLAIATHVGAYGHAFVESRETNREWILRELVDLEGAIARVRKLYTAHPEAPRTEEPR